MKTLFRLRFTYLFLIAFFAALFTCPIIAAAEFLEGSAVSLYTGETLRIRYRLSDSADTLLVSVDGTENRLNLMLTNHNNSYHYNVLPDRTVALPLNMGDGDYSLHVRVFIFDQQAEEVWVKTIPVALENQLAPYLSSSEMLRWNGGMELVSHAKTLAAGKTDADAALAIVDYIARNFKYDNPDPQPGYIPDPQSVYTEKRGICFDLAVLAVAMCRAAGIPAALAMGYSEYLDPSKYHSWCLVYTGGEWHTLDPTYGVETGNPTQFLDSTKTVVTKMY